ncbi:hypothetical protein NPIL_218461 [Nephila pilipes]|uniref:Uncharacterized protein n=1 Tax=Nephila pilipes TaxID=299642 RepID=A0A8X6IA14_NEPPI|nr:hypothetical protein NPIL_218461 [Nephila pilipes]
MQVKDNDKHTRASGKSRQCHLGNQDGVHCFVWFRHLLVADASDYLVRRVLAFGQSAWGGKETLTLSVGRVSNYIKNCISACCTAYTSVDSIQHAIDSNLGIFTCFKGATLDFAQTSTTFTPFEVTDLRNMEVAYASLQISTKMCI